MLDILIATLTVERATKAVRRLHNFKNRRAYALVKEAVRGTQKSCSGQFSGTPHRRHMEVLRIFGKRWAKRTLPTHQAREPPFGTIQLQATAAKNVANISMLGSGPK